METKRRNRHRGSILERAVKESNTNISQMVKRMGISRGAYYYHIIDPDLPYELLAKYGKIIKHDFSADLPEMREFLLQEPESPYGPPKNMKEAIEQRDYWREKYYLLMEKHHKLLAGIKAGE